MRGGGRAGEGGERGGEVEGEGVGGRRGEGEQEAQ